MGKGLTLIDNFQLPAELGSIVFLLLRYVVLYPQIYPILPYIDIHDTCNHEHACVLFNTSRCAARRAAAVKRPQLDTGKHAHEV